MTALDIFVEEQAGPLLSPRLEVRFKVLDAGAVDLDQLTPIFYDVVRERPLGELLVDVTSYAHVKGGPGLLIVGQDAHYGLTEGAGATLSRTHRRPWRGHPAERLAIAIDRTLALAARIHAGMPEFLVRTDEVTIGVLDRLRAPNTRTTFELVRPALSSFLLEVWGTVPELKPANTDAAPFAVTASLGAAPTIDVLRAKLAPVVARYGS